MLLSVELLRRAPVAGYDGGKSALYELIRTLVRTRSGRWCGLRAGGISQHDFGEVLVRFLRRD